MALKAVCSSSDALCTVSDMEVCPGLDLQLHLCCMKAMLCAPLVLSKGLAITIGQHTASLSQDSSAAACAVSRRRSDFANTMVSPSNLTGKGLYWRCPFGVT